MGYPGGISREKFSNLGCRTVFIRTLSLRLFYSHNREKASQQFRVRGVEMIKYDKLWRTMKEKGISQYALYTTYNINRSQLNRLRHNQNVQVNTIDKLCNILHCQVEDIMEHVDDDNTF